MTVDLVSRVAFCQACFDRNEPNKNTFFVLYGSDKQDFQFQYSFYKGIRGFTPHFFCKNKIEENQVLFESICCVDGCGVKIEFVDNKPKFAMYPEKVKQGKMRIVDWNALIRFKDPTYRI